MCRQEGLDELVGSNFSEQVRRAIKKLERCLALHVPALPLLA